MCYCRGVFAGSWLVPIALWLSVSSALQCTDVERCMNMSERDGGLPEGGMDREIYFTRKDSCLCGFVIVGKRISGDGQ